MIFASSTQCRHLGPLIESHSCTCGAAIDIFHCRRKSMNAVQFHIDWERELEIRRKTDRVTARELNQLLARCDDCPLRETAP